MNISKKDLGKSQIELTAELTAEEFKPYVLRGAQKDLSLLIPNRKRNAMFPGCLFLIMLQKWNCIL